jgi:hypothetical protein
MCAFSGRARQRKSLRGHFVVDGFDADGTATRVRRAINSDVRDEVVAVQRRPLESEQHALRNQSAGNRGALRIKH